MDKSALLRESLLEKLRSRAWRVGERITAERELAEEFDLSRSTVRRVLQDLKRKGLITQTVGSGTYVSDHAPQALAKMPVAWQGEGGALLTWNPLYSTSAVSPSELMSARLVLEPAIIDLCVGSATEADFLRMDHCNDQAEAATTVEAFEHWDAALHEAIARAAHNGFITTLLQLMNEVRAQSEWGVLKRNAGTLERRGTYQKEHRDMVTALRQRDTQRAKALSLAHLQHVRLDMLGY
jgi:DNA-binding FadR family transcriptional regulator